MFDKIVFFALLVESVPAAPMFEFDTMKRAWLEMRFVNLRLTCTNVWSVCLQKVKMHTEYRNFYHNVEYTFLYVGLLLSISVAGMQVHVQVEWDWNMQLMSQRCAWNASARDTKMYQSYQLCFMYGVFFWNEKRK